MNIDINILVREYEQTIRELGVRLANYAIQTTTLLQRIKELEKPEKKEQKWPTPMFKIVVTTRWWFRRTALFYGRKTRRLRHLDSISTI